MNRLMTSAGMGLAALLLSSAAVLAADMSVSSSDMTSTDWTGFYAGIFGGYGWATSNHTDTLGGTTGEFSQNGWLLGGDAGYNWQIEKAVLGIEADLGAARISGTTTTNCGVGCTTELRALGTLRARLGYAADGFMPYITGGLAVGSVYSGQPGFYETRWVAGWTAGGGVEAMITPHLTVKAEYLHVELGDAGYTVAIPVAATEKNLNIVRVGLNYRF